MRAGRRIASLLVGAALLAMCLSSAPSAKAAEPAACPALVATASRLLVGVAPSLSSHTGKAYLFRRAGVTDRWQAAEPALPVSFGRNGLGWSFDQVGLAPIPAGDGLPVKSEGDGRTPAGIFAAGPPFGFGHATLENYIRITAGTVCIDSPSSPDYNRVVARKAVPAGVSHERMWEIPLYRAGMIISTPTSRALRGGSCIFLHVWRGPGQATAGCVATSGRDVARIQSFFDGQPSVLALLPRAALGVLTPCGLPDGTFAQVGRDD